MSSRFDFSALSVMTSRPWATCLTRRRCIGHQIVVSPTTVPSPLCQLRATRSPRTLGLSASWISLACALHPTVRMPEAMSSFTPLWRAVRGPRAPAALAWQPSQCQALRCSSSETTHGRCTPRPIGPGTVGSWRAS